jgi:hypothetical protein
MRFKIQNALKSSRVRANGLGFLLIFMMILFIAGAAAGKLFGSENKFL